MIFPSTALKNPWKNPQSSRTRSHEYNSTYNFNGIMIKTKISFFLYQDKTKKSKTTEEQQSKEGLSSSYGQSATQNFRTGSRNQPPLSPFNGILDFDESWPIFIEEEEGVVKTLKDLCLTAVNKDFKRLKVLSKNYR